MTRLIAWVRSWFCRHEFTLHYGWGFDTHGWRSYERQRIGITCTKCGWHRTNWRY